MRYSGLFDFVSYSRPILPARHDEKAFAVAPPFPKFAEDSLFFVIRQIPILAVLVFDHQDPPVFEKAYEVWIKTVGARLQGKGGRFAVNVPYPVFHTL